MPKFIVTYTEKSEGSQCNGNYARLVECAIEPTKEFLKEKGIIDREGYCNNSVTPGCEDCPGAFITAFNVEPFTPERARELGLVDKLYGSEGISSKRDNWLKVLY